MSITLRRMNQIKIQTKKEREIEINAHKNIIYSIMIPNLLDDLFTPPGEVSEQKRLLSDLCERTSAITAGTPGIKFKFNGSTYLTEMYNRFETKIQSKFGDTIAVNAFVTITLYMLTLDERQKNVLEKIFNDDGTYKYKLLEYLHNIVGSSVTHEDIKEFKKEIDGLMNCYFKTMYI